MAKILISSDWHLKFISPFDKITESGTPSRLQEILDSINWTLTIAKETKAEYFLGLGDIFDSSDKLQTKESLAILNTFKQIKQQFSEKAIFIPGNHDQISSTQNILDFFSPLIKVFNSAGILDIPNARLFFIPYIRETDKFYEKLDYFINFSDTPEKKYLFAHFWDSTVMSVDPDAIVLSEKHLNFFDRIFSGHFHVPTENNENKLIYSGTLLNKRFNESGKKGCWLLDTKTNKLKFFENPHSPSFYNVTDEYIINNIENLDNNAYYKVSCDPLNVLTINKLLASVKGFELLNKETKETNNTENLNFLTIEKKNTSTLKDFILNNCNLFLPENISLDEFKERGKSYLSGL